MSSVPFSTVASVIGTTSAQRQVAGAQDRQVQAAGRSQQLQGEKAREHSEAVEDPGEYGVMATRDEGQKQSGGQQQELPLWDQAEKVEIEGVQTAEPEDKPLPAGRASGLDISA